MLGCLWKLLSASHGQSESWYSLAGEGVTVAFNAGASVGVGAEMGVRGTSVGPGADAGVRQAVDRISSPDSSANSDRKAIPFCQEQQKDMPPTGAIVETALHVVKRRQRRGAERIRNLSGRIAVHSWPLGSDTGPMSCRDQSYSDASRLLSVPLQSPVPAAAGTPRYENRRHPLLPWIPAFAGMTGLAGLAATHGRDGDQAWEKLTRYSFGRGLRA